MTGEYGADVTRAQFIRLVIAICTGTLIEWFDFTIYTGLSATISAVFFDAKSGHVGYWAIWAVGFVSRPAGAVLFGHLGDTRGRRFTLLLSILCVSVPTILIGALPTYAQAGAAAPVLLGIMRAIQGLAVGGEFGSAIIYLFEVAPRRRKGMTASFGQAAFAPGIILGLIAILIVTSLCSPAQMQLWGWRIPFLMTVFTAPIALLMRMHMPEPHEFLQSKEAMTLQRIATLVANRVASEYVHQEAKGEGDVARSTDTPHRHTLSKRQLSSRLVELTDTIIGSQDINGAAGASNDPPPLAQPAAMTRYASLPIPEGSSMHMPHAVLRMRTLPRHGSSNKDQSERCRVNSAVDDAVVVVESKYMAEVDAAAAAGSTKHHVPLQLLFSNHWRQLTLFIMLEATFAVDFYVFLSWLPVYLRSPAVGVAENAMVGPLLVGMVLFATGVVTAGRVVCDTRLPKLWSLLAVYCVLIPLTPPALLWAGSGSVAARWVVTSLGLFVSGCAAGILTSIGPTIFPSGVRLSGYNFAHNIAASLYGGIVPIIVTLLEGSLRSAPLAAGVMLLACSALSLAAMLPMARLAPHLVMRAPISDAVDSARLG